MSLIESFFILFKTDADKVTAELDKAETSAEGLSDALNSVGKVDTSGVKQIAPAVEKSVPPAKTLNRELTKAELKAKQLGTSFVNVAKGIAAPLLALASVGGAVAAAVSRAGEINTMAEAAKAARVNIETFDAVGRSAKAMGGTVEGANESLKNLAAKGLKDSKGNLKDTSALLLDLAASTQKMSKARGEAALQKAGITDPGLIKLLLQGRAATKEYIDAQIKNGAVTREQAEVARAYKEAQDGLSSGLKDLSSELMTALLPALTTGTEWLTKFAKWCKENKTVVAIFFGVVATAAAAYAIVMTQAALATIITMAPILAIIAACAAFALVLEDVLNFLNGQPSLLGKLANQYPEVAAALKLIGQAWNWVKEKAEPVIDFLKAVFGMITSLWKGDLDGFKTHAQNALTALKTFFSGLWDDFKGLAGKAIDWVLEKLKNLAKDMVRAVPGMAEFFKVDGQKKNLNDLSNLTEEELAERRKKNKELMDRAYGGSPVALPPHTAQAVQEGQKQIDSASTKYIPPGAVNSNQMATGGGDAVKKIETNNNVDAAITINVEGMSAAEVEALVQRTSAAQWKKQLSQASSGADNGVAR